MIKVYGSKMCPDCEEFEQRQQYVKTLNKKLRDNLSKYKNVKINTVSEENPFILNISVVGVKATEFKQKLEEYGICISIKSACTVTITPSRRKYRRSN